MAQAKVKTTRGKSHVSKVMRAFYEDDLRSSSGETVTEPEQAQAIAMSEARAGESRGFRMRTWKGRRRMRPVLKES